MSADPSNDPRSPEHGRPRSTPPPAVALTDRMRDDLKVAMRGRDQVQVRAIRTAMGAIANAEAPPIGTDARRSSDEPVVGRLIEHVRTELTDADLQQILAAEVADRHDTAEQFEAHGRAEEAAQVRAEAEVIDRYRR